MSKLARAFGYFSLGLGISLLIGYWLKQEELRNRKLITREPEKPSGDEDSPVVLSQKTLNAAKKTPPPIPAEAADDLTQLRGVGPRTAEALQAIGITSYRQIASASAENLLSRLQDVRGITAQKIESWIEQAAELAS
ncbi:MAG TPA: DUF4332 domain-containing protein [Aggregatilineales bacterium]|nr:DUF4332 domain-containing protein [Aggregatilineales bacterium]